MAECDHTVKIILLGDFIVNKWKLLRVLRELPAEAEMECLNAGSGVVDMLLIREGKRVRLRVSDTGGQERFRSITASFYRGVHGCLLLFDVTKKSTFDSLHDWQRDLRNHTITDDVVITLGGCHDTTATGTGTGTGNPTSTSSSNANATTAGTDSRQQQQQQQQQQAVPKRKAQDFAAYLGGPYRELNVKNWQTVVQALEDLVDRILLKASRVPEFSTTITPLHQRLQERESKNKAGRKKSSSRGKSGGTCVCL